MEKMVIEGGRKLEGTVEISGSKNAALPILASCILLEGKSYIENIPNLTDVKTLCLILKGLGLKIDYETDNSITINVEDESDITTPYEHVRKMRGSICVLGPLLGKRKEAQISLPGGCVIGNRAIDLHIKGLKALGAEITLKNGNIVATASRLKGTEIDLKGPYGPTVLGTCNILTAAVLAEGRTTIINAAREPEVQDVANFLNRAGAKIQGVGENEIIIDGVKELKGVKYKIIPDRIEAGTFMVAGAITKGNIVLKNVCFDNLTSIIHSLNEIGVKVENNENGECRVTGTEQFNNINISTLPYPGLPTDMQAQITALLATVNGKSVVTEKIFPDRFMHTFELARMGANIIIEENSAIINGVDTLYGARVMASDLRASASLIIAGLAARGTTEVDRLYHIDRGYEKIEEKLTALGARLKRVKY
ncbi:MAG: UDP-N-acetylglucosamine 1-carboxyvinyltransferase [Candidatus Anammoxibacter sp.]